METPTTPGIAKHFDTTWKTLTLRSGKQRTKRCGGCNKLLRVGDQVHGEYIIKENTAHISGNIYKAGYWYFWHIEHDRHDMIVHLDRCCDGIKTADQIAKEAGYESHADFKTQMQKLAG